MRRLTRHGVRRALSRFAASERGTVAIIFALVAIPVAGISAFAIDYGRASRVQTSLQRAGDAAAEALVRHLHEPQERLMVIARTNLDANLPEHLKNLPFTVQVSPDKSTISLSVATEVPTSLLGVMGVQKLDARSDTTFRVPMKPILPAPGAVVAGGSGGTFTRKPTEAEWRELQHQVDLLERQLDEAVKSGRLPPQAERTLREFLRRERQ